jgi:phosphate transport system protein
MAMHLMREIENLKREILTLGACVEDRVREATLAIENRDAALARSIVEKDVEIDDTEVKVEETCLKILALHQPVAIDLRFIIAVLKINNDLERIGDLAVNIAERAEFLANRPPVKVRLDFVGMAHGAQAMVTKSLDALVNMSTKLASEVCDSDNEIDAANRKMYVDIQQAIREVPDQIESLIHLLSVSRHLERIADHATNIAEDVIYMIDGQIVRHHAERYE